MQTVNSAARARPTHRPPAIVLGVCGLHDSFTDVFICLCASQPAGSQRLKREAQRHIADHKDKMLNRAGCRYVDRKDGREADKQHEQRKTCLLVSSVLLKPLLSPFSFFVCVCFFFLSFFSFLHHMLLFKPKHGSDAGPVMAECHRPPGLTIEPVNGDFDP